MGSVLLDNWSLDSALRIPLNMTPATIEKKCWQNLLNTILLWDNIQLSSFQGDIETIISDLTLSSYSRINEQLLSSNVGINKLNDIIIPIWIDKNNNTFDIIEDNLVDNISIDEEYLSSYS